MLSPHISQTTKQVTDTLAKTPQKVTDLSADEIKAAHDLYWNYQAIASAFHLMGLMKDGYTFFAHEKEAIEKFISMYNNTYNSPLAKALEEKTKEEF